MTIVDTDILIDAGRGVPEAIDCLKDIKANSILTISIVTQMELMVGCRNKSELQKLDRFLKQFQIVKLNEAISDKEEQEKRLHLGSTRTSLLRSNRRYVLPGSFPLNVVFLLIVKKPAGRPGWRGDVQSPVISSFLFIST